LRTSATFGYTSFDSTKGVYSLVEGPELDELEAHLGSQSAAAAEALRSIYAEAQPPFKIDSQEAKHCLKVWRTHRPSWKNSKSSCLRLLLDGIVATPLLASIAFYAHWDDEGQVFDHDQPVESLDFSSFDDEYKAAMSNLLKELQLGMLSSQGILSLRPEIWETLAQAESYFMATSHAPLLSNLPKILAEEPGWGFGENKAEEDNPVSAVLNKVGKSTTEGPMHTDLLRHLNIVFEGENFASQPKGIMVVGCEDANFMIQIYRHIQENLPRGQHLDDHPLMMIAAEGLEENRMSLAVTLSQSQIPYLVQNGALAKPVETLALLKKTKKKKMDPKTVLYIRAFKDHQRAYVPPSKQYASDSPLALYAKAQMGDFVHLDSEGNLIEAVDMYASLVEHFERWSTALEGSFGLCMAEEMSLDVPTTRRFINDSLAFSSGTLGSLARQYRIAPGAYVMAGAMAGLFPAKYDQVQNYPEQGKYTLVLNQHLVRKPFVLRFAELSDLPELLRLEELGWAQHLRKDEEHLRRRLETSPTTCFVCEMNGKLIAVLYVQKIASLEAIDTEVFDRVSDAHDPAGRILQLLAIVADTTPEVKALGIGNELRCFALHMARMDPGIDFVCAVTLCGDFNGEASEMQTYVDKHVAGKIVDPIVGFHTGYGAKVVKIVPDYRPEDTKNKGIGVLIKYDIKDWKAKDQALGPLQAVSSQKKAKLADDGADAANDKSEPADTRLGLELVSGIMEEIGYPVDNDSIHQGFFSFGMDSLDLVRIRNRIGGILGVELSSTLLLDYPNVGELADFLDKERGMGKHTGKVKPAGPKSVWEKLTEKEINFVLDKYIKFYSLPQYQNKIEEAKNKAESNSAHYAEIIQPIRNEVEGPILVSNEVIPVANAETIGKVRKELDEWIARNGLRFPRTRAKHNSVLDLIKMAK